MYSLEWLLDPITPATFFQDFYERQPLLIEREDSRRFEQLLTTDQIDRFLATTSPSVSEFFLVDASRELKPEDYSLPNSDPPGRIDVPRVHQLFRTGATISLSHLNERLPQLAALCEAAEKAFSQHFQTNIYLSPPNAQGFKTHYDNHDVFVLQISGSKVWTLNDTQVELPLQGQGFDPEKHVAGPATREFTLHAGDLLYCPRGLFHSARSTEETSLHITLGLIGKTWADVMIEAMSEACLAAPEYRRNLPIGFANDGFDPGEAAAIFRSLAEQFAAKAQLPAILDRFANDFVTSRRPVLYGGLQVQGRADRISGSSSVSPRPNLICRIREQGEQVEVLFGSSIIRFPAFVRASLEFCLKGPSFRVLEIPGELDEPGKLVLVRRLVQEGLLVRADHVDRALTIAAE